MRILITRIGRAWGDHIICTPLIKYLKEQGNEIYFLGGEAAEVLTKRNPYIDKFIMYKEDTVTIDKLDEFIDSIKKAYECDTLLNLSGSLENSLLRHPNQPEYNDSKSERILACNRNVYDYVFEFAGYPEVKGKLGEIYPDPKEEEEIKKYIENVRGKDGFVILWGLAGSGGNKSYPHYSYIWNDLICKYKDVKIISVGDEICRILEVGTNHPRFIPKSGKWSMTESMIATKYVDLVISPDTGLYHAKGCFDTPGISILGHGTKWHTAGNFKNDYSIEADQDQAPCAPCFKLIYEGFQCPRDDETGSPICMSLGHPRERLRDHIFKTIDKIRSEK